MAAKNLQSSEASIENLRLVASCIDWSSYDRLMGKIFYDKFGKILEQKVKEFEEYKQDLKESVRRNYGDPKAMQTPKRMKPAAALLEKISQFKALNFDSDEDGVDESAFVGEPVQQQPIAGSSNVQQQQVHNSHPQPPPHAETESISIESESNFASTPPQPQQLTVVANNDVVMETPPQAPANSRQPPVMIMTTPNVPSTPATPAPKRQKVGTPLLMKPLNVALDKKKTPAKLPPPYQMEENKENANLGGAGKRLLNNTFQKKQKLKEMDQKVTNAQMSREEYLREKAERAKREREENMLRVAQNKKMKEAERRDREQQQREQEARVKKFVHDQKMQDMGSPMLKKTPNKKTAVVTTQTPKVGQQKQQPNVGEGTGKSAKTGMEGVEPVEREAQQQQSNLPTSSKAIYVEKQMPQNRVFKEEEMRRKTEEIVLYLEEDEPQENHPTEEGELDQGALMDASAYDLTSEKVFIPSTEDNYNVDDLSSGDETDTDDQPRKTVPKWAEKANIHLTVHALQSVLTTEQIERHFGRIRQPTVQQLFKGYNRNYPQRRASSAEWNSPMSNPTPGIGRFQNQQFNSPRPKK